MPWLFIGYPSPQNRYKERNISLPETWAPVFLDYKAEYQLIDRVFPWSQRSLEYLLEDLGEEAALDKHLSFDMCRCTSALRDCQGGVEPDKVRQKLGVSKIQWRELFIKIRQLNGELK